MRGLEELLGVLDEQASILTDLVEIGERELQHILSFDGARVQGCVDEKKALLDADHGLARRRKSAISNVIEGLGLSEGDVETLRDLVPLLPAVGSRALAERCDLLEQRTAALRRVHEVNLEHAERGAKLAHAYTALLRGSMNPIPSKQYGASGRTSGPAAPGKASTVHRCA
jgi:flagellar biosynthesis/type III secretory pathway chaperone